METVSAPLAFCAGNSVNSPHKGQWQGALMFSLICVWNSCWVNNGDAGDLSIITIQIPPTFVCYPYPYTVNSAIVTKRAYLDNTSGQMISCFEGHPRYTAGVWYYHQVKEIDKTGFVAVHSQVYFAGSNHSHPNMHFIIYRSPTQRHRLVDGMEPLH